MRRRFASSNAACFAALFACRISYRLFCSVPSMDCWRAASRWRRSAVSDASAASHSGFWVRGDGPVVVDVVGVVVEEEVVVVVCKTGADGFAVVCACACVCVCVVEAGVRFVDVGASTDAGADAGDVALDAPPPPPPPPSPSPTMVPPETKREDVDIVWWFARRSLAELLAILGFPDSRWTEGKGCSFVPGFF